MGKTSIYLTDPIRTKLRTPPRGPSRAVSETIDRYYALIAPERKRVQAFFTEAEWNSMRNACNGTAWTGDTIRDGVLVNIQDSLDEEITRFCADRAILESKLRDLSPAAQYALVEEIEQWWEQYGVAEEEPEE